MGKSPGRNCLVQLHFVQRNTQALLSLDGLLDDSFFCRTKLCMAGSKSARWDFNLGTRRTSIPNSKRQLDGRFRSRIARGRQAALAASSHVASR